MPNVRIPVTSKGALTKDISLYLHILYWILSLCIDVEQIKKVVKKKLQT